MAIYATVPEVRTHLGPRLPGTVPDATVQAWITRATDAIDTVLLWEPDVGDDDRPADPGEARWLRVAVAETVAELHRVEDTSPQGLVDRVVEAGGSVRAGSLAVELPATGSRPARGRVVLPPLAVRALHRAGLIGGSVAV